MEATLYKSIMAKSGLTSQMYQLCIDLLSVFEVNNRDQLLLRLSIVRILYSIPLSSASNYKLNEICQVLLHSQESNVLISLVKLLNHVNLLICYGAFKALLAVLTSQYCPIELFQVTLSSVSFQYEINTSSNGLLFNLQLLTDVLKVVRKNKQVDKNSCCKDIVTSFWITSCTKITSTILKGDNCSHQKQIVLQLLSLNIEAIKHFNKGDTLEVYVSTLHDISCITYYLSCQMCYMKFTDLLMKYIEMDHNFSPLVAKLYNDCFFNVESGSFLGMALQKWFIKEGKSQMDLVLYKTYSCVSRDLHDEVNSALIRKSFLLLLKLFSSTNDVQVLLQNFVIKMKEIIATQVQLNNLMISYVTQCLLLYLVSEQDNCLVTTLNCSLQLTRTAGLFPVELQVISLMIEFMCSVSFDHSVLLDLIISTETEFDCFFESFVGYLSNESSQKELLEICKTRDLVEAHKNEMTNAKSFQLVDYSDSDSDEDESSLKLSSLKEFIALLHQLNVSLTKTVNSKLVCESKLIEIDRILTNLKRLLNYF